MGAYWPPNKDIVEWIGKFYSEDEAIVKQAKLVWKFGTDAWKQSPDNTVNKVKTADPANQAPIPARDNGGGNVDPLR